MSQERKIEKERNLNAKIAIIGAGPAGLHVAKLLKNRGFKNIVIFEKTNRLGGKVYTLKHDSQVYEMGACYVSVDYPLVLKLAEEYGCELIPIQASKRFVADASGNVVPFEHYLTDVFFKTYIPKWLRRFVPKISFGPNILINLIRYSKLHRKFFQRSKQNVLDWQISVEQKQELIKPFLQFIKDHKLQRLIPFFEFSHTCQGYGDLSSIPTYYALMWTTPKLIISLAREASFSKIGMDKPCLKLFVNGFEELFLSLAKKENLEIRYNTHILEVDRHNASKSESPIAITYQNEAGKSRECFDYLFLACGSKSISEFLDKPTSMENEFLKASQKFSLTTTLFNTNLLPGYRLTCVLSEMMKETNKHVNQIILFRNDAALRNTAETQDVEQASAKTTSIAFQYDLRGLAETESREVIQNKLLNDLKGISTGPVDIIKTCTFDYFEHFDTAGIEKEYPWLINKLQGEHRTFYVGSIACFEGINLIFEYNTALINRFFGDHKEK